MKKVIAITQARVGSSRLPGKVLRKIGDKSILEIHLDRLKQCKIISDLIVATTVESGDGKIVEIAKKVNLSYYRGSQDDVLDRYYQAALPYMPDYVIRITSDCPLIDPKLIEQVVEYALISDFDYVSNVIDQNGYPDGQDIEVFKFSALKYAWVNAVLKSDREHVTAYIRNNSTYYGKDIFTSSGYPSPKNYTDVRLTIDEEKDFKVIEYVISEIGANKTWIEYAEFYLKNNLVKINGCIKRNEGYNKSLLND